MSRPTIIGAQNFRDDDGGADPEVESRLRAHAAGEIGDRQVLTALGASRLLIPVVAVATETEKGVGGLTKDKNSEVAVPIMTGKDGRRGVLAFTSVDAVRRWRPDARPVPFATKDACRAAVEEGADALVVDVSGPVPYSVQGRFLTMLAEHGTVPEPKDDPQVLALVYRVTHSEFGIERVRIHPSERADIGIRLELEERDDEVLRRVAERLAAELRHVLPGGIELSAVVRAHRDED
ncbi:MULTISPECIES: SseB family protein [Nocardiopsis]|uniref:SseB family protein n=1 Tax=Nocardiopsis lambiniae TaxID=3075539 RepID=A0ABU2M4L9_9ACTN|nr:MULTISPECIES: SseB family protein [unclassified Nocardiopsis]MDE3720236.1 SseB family protein [Nocardiopsis sp. N85]MDT0327266.1 SseB family protein [Nocardiopsis sp. DSM 44743]